MVELDCIREESGDVCAHIRTWYQTVYQKIPFLFWVIDTRDLSAEFGEEAYDIEYTKSDSGDVCHLIICRLTDDQGEQFAETYCKPPNLFLCTPHKCIKLEQDDMKRLGKLLIQEH